ncbi:MAG: DUF167 domain-containing protein [Chlamydiia bacterium]|nr:DUF167 domain-containing protein [Chlamydiia bacterium]
MKTFWVKLTPKASSNRIGEEIALENGQIALQVWVTAIPEDNKANKALLKLLSKHLKVPVSSIEIIRGQTSRVKQIQIHA